MIKIILSLLVLLILIAGIYIAYVYLQYNRLPDKQTLPIKKAEHSKQISANLLADKPIIGRPSERKLHFKSINF